MECLRGPCGPALLAGKWSGWSRWSDVVSSGPQVRPGHFGEKDALCGCNRLVAKVAQILHMHTPSMPFAMMFCSSFHQE